MDISTVINCYRRLQEIELRNNIIYRNLELLDLIVYIKRLTVNELHNLQQARRYSVAATSDCRLECLRSLCENLRICFNNLASLCSYVQTNKSIQARLYRYQHYLEHYMGTYHRLSSRLIQMSQEFVARGLLVLSHSELSRFTHDDLWEIARGIEEYNIVIDHCLMQKRSKLLRDFYFSSSHSGRRDYVCRVPQLNCINKQVDNEIFGIRLMSFSRILYKLASERSLLIAQSVHRYFFQSPPLTEALQIFLQSSSCSTYSGSSSCSCGHSSNARDYSGLEACLYQLAQIGSPVNDYLRLEYEFTSNFLDIISQSTEMLKELNLSVPKRKLHKEDTVENFMAPLVAAAPPTSSFAVTSSFLSVSSSAGAHHKSPGKPTRKGVQWSDHKDVSLRHQVIGRYLSVVWRMVDCLLSGAKYSNWSDSLPLGPWLLLPPPCRNIVAQIILRMTLPEFFPVGFIPVLQHQTELIASENLLITWDRTMCQSTLLHRAKPAICIHPLPNCHHDNLLDVCKLIFKHIEFQLNKHNSITVADMQGESIPAPLEQIDPLSTLLSVITACSLPQLCSALRARYIAIASDNTSGSSVASDNNSGGSGGCLAELAALIWPHLTNWARLERDIHELLNTALAGSDSSRLVAMTSVDLRGRLDTGVVDSIESLRAQTEADYEARCRDKMAQLLDMGLSRQERSPPPVTEATVGIGGPLNDAATISAEPPQPSAYAQAAVLALLEPLVHSTDAAQSPNRTQDNDPLCQALLATLDILCRAWRGRLEFLSHDKLLSATQIRCDVSVLRLWLHCHRDRLPHDTLAMLQGLDSLLALEAHVSGESRNTELTRGGGMGGFLQRQTSGMGQRVLKGCVWVREEIKSRSPSSSGASGGGGATFPWLLQQHK